MKSATALANAKSEELRHRSIQLHLDSMTPLLCNFLTGIESQGDQLINEIALACQQVNDHLVVANISEYKTGPAEFGRVDVQKVMGHVHVQLLNCHKWGIVGTRSVIY